jgi:O-antigen/teichoic acid export membrane protein
MIEIAIGHIINASALVIGILIAIQSNYSIIGFAFIPLIANIFNFLIFFTLANFIYFKIKIILDFSFLKNNFKSAIPFGMTSIFMTIYLWNGSVFLSLFATNDAVGYFNASYKIVLAFLGISYAINIAVFPLMSKYFVKSPTKLIKLFNTNFKVFSYIAIPMAFGGTFLANQIITTILGNEFLNSIIVFQLLIWSIPFIFLRSTLERVFEIINKQHLITLAYGIGVIVSITLNIIIIPFFGYIGASLVVVIVEILIFSILILKTRNEMIFKFEKNLFSNLFKSIISSLGMVIVLYLVKGNNPVLNIILGLVSYFTLLLLLKGFDKEDYNSMKKIFS